MVGKTWTRISVPCGGEAADAVAAFLGEITGRGVWIEGDEADKTVVAYIEPEAADDLVRSLKAFIDSFSSEGKARCGPVSCRETPEEDWMAVFRSQHGLVAVSDRLAVRPTWVSPGAGREVVIDPGLAFGTGSHASTRLCLVLLDEAIGSKPPPAMLDLGTGTGVLAIASVVLGVPRAVAVDIDPVATGVARENAERNRVADRVIVVCRGVGSVSDTYPLVAANLSTFVLVEEAKSISSVVGEGGRLIVSGVSSGEMETVLAAFAPYGLTPDRRLAADGWEAARLVKGAALV